MKQKWKVGDFCVSINSLIGYIQAVATIGENKMYEIDYGYFVAYANEHQLVKAYDEDFIFYLEQQLLDELEQKRYRFKTCDVYFEGVGVSIVGDPLSIDDAYDVAKLILSKIGK